MASGYTSNYGLCQWQPEDAFLREEFNEDNEKTERALTTLSQGLESLRTEGEQALDPIRYNLYQLWLRQYYEGKETGMKRAILFDSFLDSSLIQQKSDGLFAYKGGLYLSATDQVTVDSSSRVGGVTNYGGSLSTDVFTATGFGYVSTCQLTASYLDAVGTESLTASVAFQVNGVTLNTIQTTMRASASSFTLTATQNVPVCPGDQFQVVVTAPTNNWLRFEPSAKSASTMAAVITFRSGAAQNGTMTSTAFGPEGSFEKARLYLHRRDGAVTPKLNGTAMTFLSTSDTVDEEGADCKEDAWELAADIQSPLTVSLAVERGSDAQCSVLDYGVILS